MAHLRDMVTISLFLNLAVKKVRDEAGSIAWLLGENTPALTEYGSGEAQETQCLAFGSTLWIANNDDDDSKLQMKILTKAGVGTAPQLIKLVDKHGGTVLPTNEHTHLLSGGGSGKEKLLYKMRASDNALDAHFAARTLTTAIPTIKLVTAAAPRTGCVAFVLGKYDTDGHEKFHAEQKLLAAVGRYIQHTDPRPHLGDVPVGGIKAPCRRCGETITAVQERVDALGLNITFKTVDATVAKLRTESSIGTEAASDIAKMTIDTYFPRPE